MAAREVPSVTAATVRLLDDVPQPVDYARRLESELGGPTELIALDRASHWVVEDRPDVYASRPTDRLP